MTPQKDIIGHRGVGRVVQPFMILRVGAGRNAAFIHLLRLQGGGLTSASQLSLIPSPWPYRDFSAPP